MSKPKKPTIEGLKKAREIFKNSYKPVPPSDESVDIVEESIKINEEDENNNSSKDKDIAAKPQPSLSKETAL